MKIIHFDVDSELSKYLKGTKKDYSIQNIQNQEDFEAEIISIKTSSQASQENLSKFKNLKRLITRTVGQDHIDMDYCKKKGIEVKNILDYGSFNIAEHAFALLLSLTRNIISSQKDIKNGKFSFEGHLSFSLKGKVIGVIGTGRIGLEMIKRAVGFEMKVLAYDVFKNEEAAKNLGFRYVSLEDLLKDSDVISLHVPLLPETKHIINKKSISKMKDGVILINTARGEIVDTNALIEQIDKFRFIGLDVLEGERGFDKNNKLLKFKNVLITPHVAFYSDSSVKKIAEETEKAQRKFD